MIIQRERSIIPACDVPPEKFEEILHATADIDGVGAYKIPHKSGRKGWESWIEVARKYTDKPLIYDAEKLGTSTPETSADLLREIKESGFDAAILFPFTGPIVEYECLVTAKDIGLEVILGSIMTHHRQIEGDFSNPKYKDYTKIFKELGFQYDLSGFLKSVAPTDIYRLAARLGVTDYVTPGNIPHKITNLTELLKKENVEPTYYSTGFVIQGGNIAYAVKVAGKKWHAIIGRALYEASDMRAAALEFVSQIDNCSKGQ